MDNEPLWAPSPARVAATSMDRFIRSAGFDGYEDTWRWSIDQPEEFWAKVWIDCAMVGSPGTQVVGGSSSMPTTLFFPDATTSVAEQMLRGIGDDRAEAVVALDESGNRRSLSWSALRSSVAGLAAALHAAGVGPGDRVAAWLPNGIEALVAMLGAASIGAVFSSSSPDFGTQGVLDRFGQIEPKVLFAAAGYTYGGKFFDCLGRLAEIRRGLPTVTHCIVVGAGDELPAGAIDWPEFVSAGHEEPFVPQRFPFDHPWYILYSSGTTGVPKCIVHRTGGVLIQHLKEHQLQCDIRPGDRVFYFTTTGWMMWNWLVSALGSGATIVLYDGSPAHPTMDALFDIVDGERITLLGTSAKFIDALRKGEVRPIESHDLSTLRTICSTGSPLSVEGYRYVYESVKAEVHLASITGGTDLCATFIACDPTSAVYAGEIQRPTLGMATDAVDSDGVSLADRPGVAGELVCTKPFPSMPLGFWKDGTDGFPNPLQPGPRYVSTYFEGVAGVWTHGDYASWTSHGGMVIHGRSDATLNPGGVRIGTAEIYRAVEQLDDVVESLVFAQDWEDDVRIVLLVRLAEGVELDEALRAEIRRRIRAACTPRHVPAVIAAVDDLPRTRSNKLVEIAVAQAVNGHPVRNTEAIANPESIAAIVALDTLRS